MKGRKRHRLVDVPGLVLVVIVQAASVQEQAGTKRVFVRLVRADAGYHVHWLREWVRTHRTWVLEIVSRPAGSKGFVLLPRLLPGGGWWSAPLAQGQV